MKQRPSLGGDSGDGQEPDGDQQTATRYTLSSAWEEQRRRIDWMQAPMMPNYVNGLVSGRSLEDGGHWAIYAREQYLEALAAARGPLTMVSLASGSGHIEESLIRSFGWPVKSLLGLEYDLALRKAAEDRFRSINCDSTFQFFDFNSRQLPANSQFDVVFACHSLHHASDIENLLAILNTLVRPDGLIIGIDFFGPTRFQIQYETLPLINELFTILPPELRRNLLHPDLPVEHSFSYPTIEDVRRADISESVHSSDLRTLLFANFPVVEIKPMGGTILRWLLQYRAGNFDHANPDHVSIARLLQFIERNLILSGRISSDDLFFVLKKSDRVPTF